MNWATPARPYFSPQLQAEGISGRAVNMDPEQILCLPQLEGSPILDEEHINSLHLSVPTYSHNHQANAEARSLVGCSASP